MKDWFYDGFEEVLTAPLEDVPLFVNDDRAMDGISVKNLVAWRLKIGK